MAETSLPELPNAEIKAAFADDLVIIAIDSILTTRSITDHVRRAAKYQQIKASIIEVGIIEPPVVYPDSKSNGRYLLLDGHLRIDVLKETGATTVTCLVSLDDEAFTFNKYINRVAPVQENRMIIRAIERGVSMERLAAALNMDIRHLTEKRDLLKGICPEVAELLKDKMFSPRIFASLKKMQPVRQIEAVRLMIDADVFTESYGLALLAGTPPHMLVQAGKPKKVRQLDYETMARMEREMEGVQKKFELIENDYAVDVVHFTFAKGYLTSLLGNVRVVRYLATNHPDILSQFQCISEVTSLGANGMSSP